MVLIDGHEPIDGDTGRQGQPQLGWIEQWVTVWDQVTCERCEGLHGAWMLQGEGPVPPLHPHCRCRRVPVQAMADLRGDTRIVAALRLAAGREQVAHALTLSTASRELRDWRAQEKWIQKFEEQRSTRGGAL